MHKRDFFLNWDREDQVTREVIKAFPEAELKREIISGLRPPGPLFCHIFAHVDVLFNACITGRLKPGDFGALPEAVDTGHHMPLLQYALRTMQNILAHGSVGEEIWKQAIATQGGPVSMASLCFDAFAHEMHHRGQLCAMLRLLSITPPAICTHEHG